jgi:hypothetical protein
MGNGYGHNNYFGLFDNPHIDIHNLNQLPDNNNMYLPKRITDLCIEADYLRNTNPQLTEERLEDAIMLYNTYLMDVTQLAVTDFREHRFLPEWNRNLYRTYVRDAYVLFCAIRFLLQAIQPDDLQNEIQDIQQAKDNSWMVFRSLYQNQLVLFTQEIN